MRPDVIMSMLISVVVPAIIALYLHKRKTPYYHFVGSPFYIKVISFNWIISPIAFLFTYFLVPYTICEDLSLSIYFIQGDIYGLSILLLILIGGVLGFILWRFIINCYFKVFLNKLTYWFPSVLCLIMLISIVVIDIYSASSGSHISLLVGSYSLKVSMILLPIALIILSLPLYFTE